MLMIMPGLCRYSVQRGRVGISVNICIRLSPISECSMIMSMMSSLNISISMRRKLMLVLMSRLSSLAHKLLMLMFFMRASQVRTGLNS